MQHSATSTLGKSGAGLPHLDQPEHPIPSSAGIIHRKLGRTKPDTIIQSPHLHPSSCQRHGPTLGSYNPSIKKDDAGKLK